MLSRSQRAWSRSLGARLAGLGARGALYLAMGFFCLAGLTASAEAQAITSVTVSPTTFSAAGQTLTFSIGFTTSSQLNSLTIAANSIDTPDDTVVCPASFPITNVPASFTCTATHVTTAFDVSAGYALETPTFVAVTTAGPTDSGAGSQVRATFVSSSPTSTTTTVSSSVNPSTVGQSVTLTATVAGSGSSPTGTVTFSDGATTLGSATLSGGQASFPTSALSVGSHTITASYGGDTNNSASSGSMTQTVNKATSTTALASSVNPSASGQNVTFTATVTGVSPTGTVTFKDGATTLGSATLSGGQASFTTSALSVGSHTITASYGGDTNNNASSGSLTQTVNKATSTTALASSVNPSTSGQSVTFTATVTGVSPTGTVTFKDGATTLGSATLSGGQASFTTSALSVGSHTITASYGGDTNNNSSTATLTQVVNQATSTTTLSSSVNPSTSSQSVTFTAAVTGVSPTGTVTFKDGATTLGSATLSGGQASFTTSALSVGSHTIAASYGGDTNNNSSTATLTQVVNQATSTTTLSSSVNPSTSSQSVTFTAAVTGVSPTGTVTFKDGATTLGSATLSGGQASFTTSALSVGSHTITASYGGDTNNNSSTATLTQVVNQATATTSLNASSTSSTVGAAVTFTAAVTGVSPTGTVTFKDGATTLGSATLSGGQASFTTSALSVGSHSITATYGGDVNNKGSASTPVTVVVQKATLSVVVTASTTSPNFGTSVALTARVTGGFSPTGSVNFLDGGKLLATVSLSNGQAQFATATLAVGSHSITVAYLGDGNNQPAASPALSLTVGKTATSTSLMASASSVLFNSPVSFSATVTGQSPTGTVTFKDGATGLGTAALVSGKAVLTVSNLSVGNHSVVATYNGDGNNAPSSSSAVTVAIGRPNPAADPNVQGLVTAQATAEVNFAQTQTNNITERLEALHSDDTPFFSNNLAVSALPGPTPNSVSALADEQDSATRDPAFSAIDKATRKGAPAASAQTPPFAIWTAGAILYGATNVLGTSSNDNRFTTSGVTVGLDGRIVDGLKAGFAIGFGDDHTSIGTNGATSAGANISGTAYVDYHAFGSLFFDGLLGYGSATFHSNRFVPLPSLVELGTRQGSELFGALMLTSEQKWDALHLAPYARMQFIDATLGAYTEQGDPTWALSYASASMQEVSGVLGIRGSYDIGMSWGVLSPTVRLEYAHAFNTSLTQVLTYADTPATNYSFPVAGLGQNTGTATVGLVACYPNGVTANLEFQYSDAGAEGHAQGLRGALNIPF